MANDPTQSLAARLIASTTGNAVFLLLVATFFWGGNAVAGRLANGEVSPLILTQIRWLLGCSIVLPFAYPHLKRDWPVIRKHLLYFFAMGAAGYTFFNILLYTALTYTSAINVSIEQAAMPLFIFAMMALIYRSPPTWVQIGGYVLTLIGVAFTVSQGSLDTFLRFEWNRGDVIMMGAAFTYAAYSVALRAKPNIHWLSFLACLTICAAIIAVPFAIYETTTDKFIFPTSPIGIGVSIFAGIFPSVVCQAAFIRAVEIMGQNQSSIYLNIVPIFGTILAILILGETFALHQIIGLLLVIGGIVIAQRFKK